MSAALDRCDREIAAIEADPDIQGGSVPAWLVCLALTDWLVERELIAEAETQNRKGKEWDMGIHGPISLDEVIRRGLDADVFLRLIERIESKLQREVDELRLMRPIIASDLSDEDKDRILKALHPQVYERVRHPKVVTETEIGENGAQVLADADQGVQTVVVAEDGRARSVIGLNEFRYLPDPDPDPLGEAELLNGS